MDPADDDGAGKKNGEEEPEFSASAFEALERDFQEVLANLVGDKSLERFRMEYEKLHRALKRSHEHERKLIKKVRELNTEIVNNAAKVHTALKLSQEDQNTIATLRKEIEKAWKLVDVAHEKESRAKETINHLKDEISNLSKLVEKGAKMSNGQETMVKELMKTREELQRQSEEQQAQAKVLESQLQELHSQRESLDDANKAQAEEIGGLKEQLDSRQAEIKREQRRRERLDKELRETREKLDSKTHEQEAMTDEVDKAGVQIDQLEKQLSEARTTMEKYLRDYDSLYNRTQKLTEDLEEQIIKNQQLHVENVSVEKEMKSRREEIVRLNTEKGLMERKLEREHRAMLQYKQKLDESKTPLVMAQAESAALSKDIDQFKRDQELMAKEKEGVERERDLQFKNTQKAEEKVRDVETAAREQERIAYSLENEMNGLKSETVRQRKTIYQLEKEREKYVIEGSEQRSLYVQSMEEVKLRDMRINEFQKKVSEWESKLKQQQQLYESVRSDRNLYSKNLIEAQDEIAEMKRKFKIMSHQIEQLKEEISEKDRALVKESFDHQKVEKQCEQMRNETSRMKRQLETNDDVIHKQDAEIQRLASMIRRMDEEALTQRKEYDQVINERDILGTQLIRRNDELALLYEKLKIQMSTLRKGEAQYAARLQDVRVLRLKIRDLMRELSIAKGSTAQLDDLKPELVAAQRELLQEKTKVKALSEELENPMNVHRWRKLEGSDPATYEMIQKIQTLQKRLIAKTEEVVEKDLLISEKEKLYVELKNILARQPGPEVAEQLSVYQSSLRNKTRQMKSMASELNMYQAQVNEFKYEIERLTRELQDVKRKYYEQKRREQLANEIAAEESAMGRGQAEQQLAAAQKATTSLRAEASQSGRRFKRSPREKDGHCFEGHGARGRANPDLNLHHGSGGFGGGVRDGAGELGCAGVRVRSGAGRVQL
eukprot:CAMPEP_0182572826 /NCGR_PEP_ID=MMETSP1324-20130603/17912_1 /TAXON_ID=236786 /ORGANISM="Florenciella sp., Strain RCC1587" /LENGTH=946 /DNA_ID=CAMNT_0024787841 /DNA_START=180 /DNA_END=3021 /DNA_ORIENTATION=+